MAKVSLLHFETEDEYQNHFEATYCKGAIRTHDNVPVYFSRTTFTHAFFESSKRDGVKDLFSRIRAERMDWILSTLQNPNADRYQGWINQSRKYDPARSVCVAYDEFVVVVRFSLTKNSTLKANFVTCYLADNSIGKIRQSPVWTEDECRNALVRKKCGR